MPLRRQQARDRPSDYIETRKGLLGRKNDIRYINTYDKSGLHSNALIRG